MGSERKDLSDLVDSMFGKEDISCILHECKGARVDLDIHK